MAIKHTIIAAAVLAALPGMAQADCVPQSVLTWVDNREAVAISPTRWQNVRKSLLGESGGMPLDEMQTIYDRRVANGWDAGHWVPIIDAMECLRDTPQVEEEQPAETEEQPAVLSASVDLPTYPAPTAHDGWFGWNAPKKVLRVTGNAPVPQQCETKAAKVRQDIIDSNWHISTLRKYHYELHIDRRFWWYKTVKATKCENRQGQLTKQCVATGDRTAYHAVGPNGEQPGKWQWDRSPLPSAMSTVDGADHTDFGFDNPRPIQYGVLQCGTAAEQTGGASTPTASLEFRAVGRPTTHSVNEGGDPVEIFSKFNANGGPSKDDYTIVFGGGTAKWGVDYKVEIGWGYRIYDNEQVSSSASWTELNPRHNRVHVRLTHDFDIPNIRITPLTDSLHGEGPETVIVKFEEPTPQINTLSYRNSYCAVYGERPHWRRPKPCLEWTGNHYELGSMAGSGYHGYQGWSDPARRSVTLTINDRQGSTTLAGVDLAVTVNDLTLAEGAKAPGLRGGCRGRFGFSDQEWCSGYHTILTWTAPNHVCMHGALEKTGGNADPGFARGALGDFNGSSWLRDRSTGIGRTHQLCGSGSKQVYIRARSDSHDEGTETATIAFRIDRALDDDQWLSPSQIDSIQNTPGTLTITNDGPLPKEWLARYGHVVASDTVAAVSDRVRLDRTPGDHSVTFGAVPQEGEAIHDESLIIKGSSFNVTSQEGHDGATISAWGKVTASSFGATIGDMALSGESVYGMAGVDYATDGWMVGVGFGQSTGDGEASPDYVIDSNLVTVFPYGSIRLGETTLWSSVGYGEGDVTLTMDDDSLGTADTSWWMAAAGARSALFEVEHVGIAVVGDAFWTEIDSERAAGFESSQASSHRERLGIEADLEWDAFSLTPTVFARLDGGDVGSETRVELAGDVTWKIADELVVSGSGSHVLDGGNEFRSYSLGLRWATSWGTPSLFYRQDDVYTLGWHRAFQGGHVRVETQPQAERASLNLALMF